MKHHEIHFVQGITAIIFSLLLSGCSSGTKNSWQSISQAEAAEIMQKEKNIIILDVRTEQEYADEHISGAVNLPNESIGTEPPALLPDKDQVILVYCRSGNRSKQAAQKLADMGYTNIKEFGGINTWTGPKESYVEKIQPVMMLDAHKSSETDGISLEVTGYSKGMLEVTLQNQSGSTWQYGEAFELSRKQGNEWHTLPLPEPKDKDDVSRELADGAKIVLHRDIIDIEPLEPGEYRFSMNGMETEFTLVMSE
ncbi:MAG: rhodanese-like domain-containing protein [Erysipelotrichaceae bacterium]|nr:rhodanese-like domain-containing protein [Erysipelotrichaceae bacterium]